jgi:hypothetical protein
MFLRIDRLLLLAGACALGCGGAKSFGQAEANVWGGLRGIRLEGELMVVSSGLRAVNPDGTLANPGGRERLGDPQFLRLGSRQISSGALVAGAGPGGGGGRRPPDRVSARVTYEDTGPGRVKVDVHVAASADTALARVDYVLRLPGAEYSGGSAELIGAAAGSTGGPFARGNALGVRIVSARRRLEVTFAGPMDLVVRPGEPPGPDGGFVVQFPVWAGDLAAGQTADLSFTLKLSGTVDRAPAHLILDPAHPGRRFEGIGGNFRLQSPLDPPQVAYNLDHLPVAWARVNLPLDRWQPREDDDPVAAAGAGRLDPSVRAAFEMERTLAQRKIPILITVWSLPRWARTPVAPRPPDSGGPGAGSTYHLRAEKWDSVCRSIGAYLDYARQHYGVEPRLFSFNETNIGYDVLQTPREHTEEIKRLGAYFAARGTPIRLVLGDVGDPTGIDFIADASADPDAVNYLGAVSFHSWRGGTAEQFERWGAAARRLDLPLFVAEGGMDSDAYRYQSLLLEPWYALLELTEYVDICRLAQPLTILQWQLTENYSLLTGGRDGRPLAPAQRFWQLKQLGTLSSGARALPIACDQAAIAACAFVDPATGGCIVDLVNNGAARAATISGFPAQVRKLRLVVTDARRGMQPEAPVDVVGGTARLELASLSFTTASSGE